MEGWALNVSRGGIRVILEENVELGAFFTVGIADGTGATGVRGQPKRGQIVWVQEEPDGVVAGMAFDDVGDDR